MRMRDRVTASRLFDHFVIVFQIFWNLICLISIFSLFLPFCWHFALVKRLYSQLKWSDVKISGDSMSSEIEECSAVLMFGARAGRAKKRLIVTNIIDAWAIPNASITSIDITWGRSPNLKKKNDSSKSNAFSSIYIQAEIISKATSSVRSPIKNLTDVNRHVNMTQLLSAIG